MNKERREGKKGDSGREAGKVVGTSWTRQRNWGCGVQATVTDSS